MQIDDTQSRLLRLAGGLMLAGFALLALVTQLFHPSHDENNHPVIFEKYAHDDQWVIVHFGQFAGVLIALGGFVVLHRFFEARGKDAILARLAFGATVATAAVYAVLQAVDGTALKEASDAWAAAGGPEKELRFADAETVRWTEWGLQSYFRLMLASTLALFGTLAIRSGVISKFAGAAAVVAAGLHVGIGVAVGHSGFDKPGGPVVQLLTLAFVAGVIVAGVRRAEHSTQAAATA